MSQLSICDTCELEHNPDELSLCALSVPWDPIEECPDCHAECGPCASEAAREFNEEHYGFTIRRGGL